MFTIATMPKTVSTSPRSIEPTRSTLAGSTPPRNGSVNARDRHAGGDRDDRRARSGPASLTAAWRSKMSSMTPTAAIATAPARIARVCSPRGRRPSAGTGSRRPGRRPGSRGRPASASARRGGCARSARRSPRSAGRSTPRREPGAGRGSRRRRTRRPRRSCRARRRSASTADRSEDPVDEEVRHRGDSERPRAKCAWRARDRRGLRAAAAALRP